MNRDDRGATFPGKKEYSKAHEVSEDEWSVASVRAKYKEGTLEWSTFRSGSVNVADLDTDHIANIIDLLERNYVNPVRACWIDIFNQELKKRGF